LSRVALFITHPDSTRGLQLTGASNARIVNSVCAVSLDSFFTPNAASDLERLPESITEFRGWIITFVNAAAPRRYITRRFTTVYVFIRVELAACSSPPSRFSQADNCRVPSRFVHVLERGSADDPRMTRSVKLSVTRSGPAPVLADLRCQAERVGGLPRGLPRSDDLATPAVISRSCSAIAQRGYVGVLYRPSSFVASGRDSRRFGFRGRARGLSGVVPAAFVILECP